MTKDEIIIAQQARIEQLVTLLREAREWNWLDDDAVKIPCREEVQDAISTKDDLSALREHDAELLDRYHAEDAAWKLATGGNWASAEAIEKGGV